MLRLLKANQFFLSFKHTVKNFNFNFESIFKFIMLYKKKLVNKSKINFLQNLEKRIQNSIMFSK